MIERFPLPHTWAFGFSTIVGTHRFNGYCRLAKSKLGCACPQLSDGSLPRGPCFSRLFTNPLSSGARRITAHRTRQAEIVAQRRSLIFGTEQTARLQFRYDVIDKFVQPSR